jgi:hypothetical protein
MQVCAEWGAASPPVPWRARMDLIGATEILPRLWIGSKKSCDSSDHIEDLQRICVETAHHDDASCDHVHLLDPEIYRITPGLLLRVSDWIESRWSWSRLNILIHCDDGNTLAPLAVAYWMRGHFGFTAAQSYDWLQKMRPAVIERTDLIKWWK